MPRFQPGDVVTYSVGGEAIIDCWDHKLGAYRLVAWRVASDKDNWIGFGGTRGTLPEKDLVPHPRGDRVVAEFTAWRLTQ